MREMKDNQFDLAIVDPPYGIGNFTPETDSGSYKKGTKKLKTKYDQNYKWNEETPTQEYFIELIRVSKRQIIWGANYYNTFSKAGGALVWYKNTGLTSQLSQCEIASLSWKKQVDYLALNKLTGFLAPIEYIHPCEKPIDLYKWLLKNYAKEGDSILDTHLGSGSSRIACHDMGFDFTGYEIDKDYFEAQEKRFKHHIQQQSLFKPNDMY
jgi:site-specific DNA-methyltransferase (adenine-specific)